MENIDCIEGLKKLKDNSIDLCFCDLPYGNKTTALKWDNMINMEEFSKQIWRISKPETPIVFTCNMKFFFEIIKYMGQKHFKFEIIFEKSNSTNPFMAKKRPMNRHEFIVFFYKKQPQVYTRNIKKYHSEKIAQKRYVRNNGQLYKTKKNGEPEQTFDYKIRLPKSIQKFKMWNSNRINSTQKPVALCEFILKYWSEKNMTILDPTFGSGSMAVACKKMNRKFIGFETDKVQFEKAKERIKNINLNEK